MADVPQITDAEWEEKVIKAERPVLVDFGAEWCGPCKQLAPTIAEIADELAGEVDVFGMDVGANTEVPAKFGIMSIPTLIVFKGGEEKARQVGLIPKARVLSLIADAR